MKFLNRLRLPLFTSDPSSPAEGEVWYNQTIDQMKYKGPTGSYPVPVHAGIRFNDYDTNRWYAVQSGGPNTANATAGRAFTNPFVLPRMGTLSGISIEVSTAWTTAGNVRVGLYNDDGGRLPTSLVADYGTVAATVGIKTWSMSTVLVPGIYWLVAVNQGGSGATTGQFRAVAGLHEYIGDPSATPSSGFFNGSLNCYYSDTGFTGSLPSSFGSVAGIALGPRFVIKFSA